MGNKSISAIEMGKVINVCCVHFESSSLSNESKNDNKTNRCDFEHTKTTYLSIIIVAHRIEYDKSSWVCKSIAIAVACPLHTVRPFVWEICMELQSKAKQNEAERNEFA